MKYFLVLPLIPFLLSGCQTMNDYVFLGSQQSQDRSSTYKLNSSVDIDKSIDKIPNALDAKKQIVGEYHVDKQWTTYLRWKIDKINLRINNEGGIVADLYAFEKNNLFMVFRQTIAHQKHIYLNLQRNLLLNMRI